MTGLSLGERLELLGDLLLIAFGVFFVFCFWEFAVYGKVWAYEPNRFIAYVELAMSGGVLLIGLGRLFDDAKRIKEADR